MSAGRKETRRQRGEIACAECRRLKVKCDRTVPCSTCVKRGTSSLCPNETLPPGDGSRFVLAAEDHLRRKMSKMEERMHSLEDALAIIQSTDSKQLHPLLARPFVLDDDTAESEGTKILNSNSCAGLADAFGGLHMDGDHGASRFFGPSGGSESLLLKAKEIELPPKQRAAILQEIDPSYLPQEINIFYNSFPLTPTGIATELVQTTIESFLPSMARATALCEMLLEHLTWMFSIVSRQHLIGELIPAVYAQNRTRARTYGPHDLALLLIALGIGALVDLNLEPYDAEAQHYYRLARAAVGLQSVLASRSIVTVKCLHLMSIYNGMSGKESNLEHSYSLLNFAGQVALGIGFHMDPSLWGIKDKEAYDRRAYFWNLLQPTLWQSLVTGRPPTILKPFIDCHIPSNEDEKKFETGDAPLGFGVWSSHFTIECLMPVTEAILASNPPSYRTIMELDRKIRDFDIPLSSSPLDPKRASTSMQTFVRSHYSDLTLMFLHRGFFAQALTDNPTNPLQSVHSQSFVTAYQCACAVLDVTRDHYDQQPRLVARVWRIWSNAFVAAVIIGTVAIRTVNANLEPPPLEKLDDACFLFQNAAETSSRALRALPILLGMREKSRQSRDVKTGRPSDELFDELAIFGGRTGLVLPKRPLNTVAPVTVPSIRLPSIPNLLHPSPTEVIAPPISGLTYRSNPQPQSIYAANNPTPMSTDLPSNWEGLYREIPESSYYGVGMTYSDAAAGPSNPPGEGVMLEDRWSSFMHHYAMIGDPQPPARY